MTTIKEAEKKIRFTSVDKGGGEIPGSLFYDFSLGVNVSDKEINEWIQKCLREIQDQILSGLNTSNPSHSIASGNTLVTCVAYPDENEKYEVTVVVAKDYASAVIHDFDPNEKFEFVRVK